ncbi:serine/threonine-protein kinase [Actinomadura sp. HBU206391]|uniref:serine/threonine-protein kinase n=1 Tax=Actinomadura sp. HBU206391 TaxID=2731692 RepID=UPI001650BAB0|nr:serine/threonine-protein kinase [Actinomadura sp. HBU206391]MBC6457335.1 serine/threonine protein kinase [Actinomadura sp. HBU206391]
MEPLRPHDPRQIGSHLLLARIGDGGMGEVFLGRSPGGRTVAVKVIHAALAGDPDFRARFRREVTAAGAVTGAFTAPVIDADPEAPLPWLVTTFLPGMSLEEAVTVYGPLPITATLVLGASLAEALISIHQAGVVHRDLKPSNIMLTPDGARVIDFGIARAADSATITQTGVAVGSPRFMAPEQATTGGTGPSGNVFSLGAVLTYAATGSPPFGDGSIPELIYRIAHQQPDLGAVSDPSLRTLIAECLEKDPDRRPPASLLVDRLLHPGGRPAGPYPNPQPAPPAVPHQVSQPGLYQGQQTVPQGLAWLPPPIASTIALLATHPLPQSAPGAPAPASPGRPPRRPDRRGGHGGGTGRGWDGRGPRAPPAAFDGAVDLRDAGFPR